MRKRSEIGTSQPEAQGEPAPEPPAREVRTPEPKAAASPPGAPRRMASMDEYDAIVSSVFNLPDPGAVHVELERALELSMQPSRAQYGMIADELDKAQKRWWQAVRLHAGAKVALANFEIDAAVTMGAIREHAIEVLQSEKEKGLRSKAITEADVELCSAKMHPDEYRQLRQGEERAKQMVAAMATFADIWKQRCRALEVMAQGAR